MIICEHVDHAMGDAEGGPAANMCLLAGERGRAHGMVLANSKQFAMENIETEFKAGIRGCLNQTGMKLI